MKDYIIGSIKKNLKERREYFLFKKIPILILKPFPSHIMIERIIRGVEESIPYKIASGLEGIYVGEFDELKDRNIQAMFKDGAIYLSCYTGNSSITEPVIVKDIIHEISHLLEQKAGYEIYGDGTLEAEFIGKRKILRQVLISHGFDFKDFYNPEYTQEFDDFLYKTVGYPKLEILIIGLFTSPYSITSLSEYFANGFEDYHIGDRNYLKDTCSVLYNKVKSIPKMVRDL